nr:unnamed protein product [Digitaria exilis]
MLEGGGAYNLAMQTHQQTNKSVELTRNLRENQLGGVIFGCKYDTIDECFKKQLFAVSSKKNLAVSSPPTKVKLPGVPEPKKVTNSKETNPFSVLSSRAAPFIWADDVDSASNTDEKTSEELVSDCDDLDDNLQDQCVPHSNPDELSQNSQDKTVEQGVELVECNHPDANPMNGERVTIDESMLLNSVSGHNGVVDNSPGGVGLQPERETILEKLKELSSLRQQLAMSSQGCADSSPDQCVPDETQINANLSCDPFDATMEYKTSSDECPGNAELLQIITDLTKRTEALEKKLIGSDQEILSLREVAKDSGRKVQQLEYLVDELQFKFDSSLSHLGSMCNTLAKPSIFLIGGYNGVTWLSSLDSFCPEKDTLVGLTPMSSPRSYASAAALDGHIFAFGGGDGMSWYNTDCPSLNRKKGSLSGICHNEKIYAIGGGDGNETYSEVEMFDPYLGKWICSPSMLLSRFALAATELNGVIYATGGYDGSMYLKSAERYDPREGFWVRLPSMSTGRGCHALTVLGDAIYAMGGYDGDKMVSSTEIYDPRLDAWRMGDGMITPRGYAAAVNLNDSLFLIGGMQSNVQILDTVEVYNASSVPITLKIVIDRLSKTGRSAGLPSIHYSYVKNVKPGMPLFLFNYTDRRLHGLFEAASPGQMSIDPYAWNNEDSLNTPFPAQVRVCTKIKCPPMLESRYKTVLSKNYYDRHLFYFELDHAQTKALVSLFKSLAPANINRVPAVSNKQSIVLSLPPSKMKTPALPDPKKVKAKSKDANPFSILSSANDGVLDNCVDSDAENGSVSENSRSDTDEKESGEPVSDWEDLDDNVLQNQFSPYSNPDEFSQNSSYKTVCQGMELAEWSHAVIDPVNGETHTFDADTLVNLHNEHTDAGTVDKIESDVHNNPDGVELQPERQTILKKLKELFSIRQQVALSNHDAVESCSDQCVPEGKPVNANFSCDPLVSTVEDKISPEERHRDYAELRQIIADLDKRAAALEKKQRFALAATELNGIIYAAGGYDGSTYSGSAERYDQREGVWVRLPSMNTRRGCHNLTVLGESLYAIGGYNGDKMVSSVEIYDPRLNAWRMGDPMSSPRGYAAAVNLDGSVYLIGGLQSNVLILDTVEVYNPSSGWSVLGFSSLGKRSFSSAVVM